MLESTLSGNLSLVYPLYFIYGLAFLFLGSSIAIKDLQVSKLKISGSLGWLSVFGFSHGVHEWMELFLSIDVRNISEYDYFLFKAVSVVIMLISFFFLSLFGLDLLYSMHRRKIFSWSQSGVLILFLALLVYLESHDHRYDLEFLRKTDILYRETICLFGSFITGYALIVYSRTLKKMSHSISRYFLYAGCGFFFYGLVAGIIPSHTSTPFFNIPIEFFRGLSAVFITYFLLKALNIFDVETRNEVEQKIRRLSHSKKMASLGNFAAGIAHGINTPLANASINLQILRGKTETSIKRQVLESRLDAIEKNIARASTIAKELLQFSYVKEQHLLLQDVRYIIDSSIELIQYKLNKVTINTQLDHVDFVLCDGNKLEQVFVNIINNAIEEMPEGGEINIKCNMIESEVKIYFSDTGPGISQENLSKVFDPFFTTKPSGKGTGLGLSICHSIIEQHQGKIEMVGAEGKGVTVIISLPVAI